MLGIACSFGVASPRAGKMSSSAVRTDMTGVTPTLGGKAQSSPRRWPLRILLLIAKGWKIAVVSADHQNKPDVAVNVTRKWADQDKVDIVLDVVNSGVGLAINKIAREKNIIYMNSGAATSDLTDSACSPNTVSWTYDTYMLAKGTGKAVVKAGGDTWFFLTADYAFGISLERDTTTVIIANGGKVLGDVRHPLSTPDFSSFLLQAQASKAKVIGLANAGADVTNSIKQAAEFNIAAGVVEARRVTHSNR